MWLLVVVLCILMLLRWWRIAVLTSFKKNLIADGELLRFAYSPTNDVLIMFWVKQMRINNFKLSWFNLFKLLYLLYSAKRQYQSSDNPVEYRTGFYDNRSGLCANIGTLIGNDEVLLFNEISPFWPHFSGNHLFPIKSSTYLSECLAYHEAGNKD